MKLTTILAEIKQLGGFGINYNNNHFIYQKLGPEIDQIDQKLKEFLVKVKKLDGTPENIHTVFFGPKSLFPEDEKINIFNIIYQNANEFTINKCYFTIHIDKKIIHSTAVIFEDNVYIETKNEFIKTPPSYNNILLKTACEFFTERYKNVSI